VNSARLAGKVAVVTGGAAGLGFAIARVLAQEGAAVAVADIDEAGAVDAVAQLGSGPVSHRAYRTDVSRAAEVDATIASVVGDFGSLDILVNNAGIARIGPHTHEVSDDDWRASIGVMQDGVFYGMRAAGRVMVEQGHGAIVNISSIRAFSTNPGRLAYCAAKAAVVAMTKVAAVEWGPHGVRVNAIAPGVCRTAMWDRAVASGHLDAGHYERTVPLGHVGDPSDVGDAVAYLVSDRARYVTGELLTVDGGLTAVPAG
jgi:NAD(P)-dependent dehydrogenase (short-subunit alcohol dehydrogenase family)